MVTFDSTVLSGPWITWERGTGSFSGLIVTSTKVLLLLVYVFAFDPIASQYIFELKSAAVVQCFAQHRVSKGVRGTIQEECRVRGSKQTHFKVSLEDRMVFFNYCLQTSSSESKLMVHESPESPCSWPTGTQTLCSSYTG